MRVHSHCFNIPNPVRHEKEGAVGVASYYYLQASRLLLQAVELGATQPDLKERAVQYRERGELLGSGLARLQRGPSSTGFTVPPFIVSSDTNETCFGGCVVEFCSTRPAF